MPKLPRPEPPKSPQELAFARAFPVYADASTAQIREGMAFARGLLVAKRKEQRRREAMAAWLAEHQLPLPLDEVTDSS